MALAMVFSQATAMIPDTSAQDRPIAAAPRGWRRRLPLVLAAVAAVVVLALAAPALQRMLTNERSVSATKLVVATVERGPFVRESPAKAASSPRSRRRSSRRTPARPSSRCTPAMSPWCRTRRSRCC